MSQHLFGSVAVITGASSGIGRATALAFARAGANVVLAARKREALEDVADECRGFAVQALPLPTDVSDEFQVRELARRAIQWFGWVDVWVNNAGVAAYGRTEDLPPRVVRRVFETNVLGCVYAMQAILPHFKEEKEGVIVNVASMVGKAGIAYMGAYVASKHALVGLADSVRQEIMLEDGAGISVCTVMPASIDTPFFQHAANFTGRQVKPVGPVYHPEEVARTILECVQNPQREVYVGKIGSLTAWNRTISAGLHDRVAAQLADRSQLGHQQVPPTEGNLFEPQPINTICGGWKRENGSRWKTAIAATAAIAVPVSLGLLARRS